MATADDHALAARVAEDAGSLLLRVRATEAGADGSTVGAEGDRQSHELIILTLRDERPKDAVLSEEGAPTESGAPAEGEGPDGGRDLAARIWIVDPLDGTREFSEGRADFAVHVALVENGVPTAGAVALPAENLVLATSDPPVLPRRSQERLRILVSRTRPPTEATAVASRLDAELVPMGSAGAKAMAVVRGEGDIYLHSGGQYEWDSAAPVAVARAAGVHASRLDGSDLVYNQPNPWLPDLLICRPELVTMVLSALRDGP
jgi:3'(2'), 5'-bisphosphate nucleotidase